MFDPNAQPQSKAGINYSYNKRASLPARIIKFILRVLRKKNLRRVLSSKRLTVAAPVPRKFFRHFRVDTTQVAGRNVFTVSPKTNPSGKHVLYIHGGAYILNIIKIHWDLIGALIKKTNATFTVPDYPLAPSANVADGFTMMEQIYKNLLSKMSSDHITIMGDSAGGGFALAFAQKMKKDGVSQPSQIILLSPWLDVSASNLEMKALEKKDPILEVDGLEKIGKSWAGSLDNKHYMVSPIYGDLTGLGQISVFIGGRDIFIADSKKLKRMLEEQGIPINYYEYPQMFHGWMGITFLKEAKHTITQISSLVNNGI